MSTLDSLLAQRERLDAQIEQVLNRPAEPETDDPDGALVVWFQVRFEHHPAHRYDESDSTVYNYAAVKARGRWWLSGRGSRSGERVDFTWDGLLDHFDAKRGKIVSGPWVATEWALA